MNIKNKMEELGLPEFANQKIIGFYQENFNENLLPYCTEHYWCDADSINVFNIVGTAHPDYIGLSWHEFIHVGKRMKTNLPLLESNPNYYLEKEKKTPTMYYIEIDGKLYVDGDGNHRSVIAKFFHAYQGTNPILHGVNLKRYTIDYRLKELIEYSNSVFINKGYRYMKVRTKRVKLSREDTAGWMREQYSIQIVVENILTAKEMIISERELQDNLVNLHKKGHFSWIFNGGLFNGLL
ncbi:MAG: hypothetical protein WC656_01830 [Sulfurimonas sp.]|jgi:hypothetical protein